MFTLSVVIGANDVANHFRVIISLYIEPYCHNKRQIDMARLCLKSFRLAMFCFYERESFKEGQLLRRIHLSI
jgi:hypothetical protein